MSNRVPLQYGCYYHIYNRGNNRGNILFHESDYQRFLALYVKHIPPIADTFAYCLLPNHFHLLVRTRREDEQDPADFPTAALLPREPSQHYSNLFNAYAKTINRKYRRTGALFERPFERVLITSDGHFVHLVTYIHYNPQKHGLVGDFRDWPFSSFRTLLSELPTYLSRDEVRDWFSGRDDFEQAHRHRVDEGRLGSLLLEE